ncbi:M48 family metallopeptidase [Desulfohalovibrio reitneri]|uniref:M48 family metallopeptidase n=1 Tax=Desulfohalovibrio reitneri TaxID=1307759 RepID=UPI00137802D9|nr:M48 family metallopeptidase [Desulfohalovibrio reitneri]
MVRAAASLLNLRALDPVLPEEFADVYDAERYARSQEYTCRATRAGLWEEAVGLAALLAALGLGVFGWLDGLAWSLGLGGVASGLAFFGLVALASEVIGLPFSIWRTFVLEEEYGFNRTTWKTFVLDRVKGLLLSALLGGGLLALVLWFFGWLGPVGWLPAWTAAAAVSLAMQYVAPVWILPLFNKFSPLPRGELRENIEGLAREQGFKLDEVYVIDGSRRSTRGNAFFAGFGAWRRAALFDTLVETMTPGQAAAVMAHEMGHARLGHVPRLLLAGLARMGLLLFLLSLFLGTAIESEMLGMRPSVHAGLFAFALLFSPAGLLLGAAFNAVSRRYEFQADRFAAKAWNARDMVDALKRLAADNLANLTPHPFHTALHASHPPVLRRIRRLSRE